MLNQVIHEDCLVAMKDLPDDNIQSIYFDPPFNLKRDFSFSPDDDIGFSDKWESDEDYEKMIEPIVIQAKRVLKSDGSFFYHISSREMFIPLSICNRHFKFVRPIYWQRSRSKNNVRHQLGAVVDVILWCSKTKPKYNPVYQSLDEKYLRNSYKNKDKRGLYALGHLVNTAPYKTKNKNRFYKIEVNDKTFNPKNGWRLSKEKLEELLADEMIHVPKLGKANLYKKVYLHESKGKLATDLWDDIHSIAQGAEKRQYPTQKPEKLLERIILMSSNEGDIILDPMCGSGTTGVVAVKNNRKVILIDKNKDAFDIAVKRIQALVSMDKS